MCVVKGSHLFSLLLMYLKKIATSEHIKKSKQKEKNYFPDFILYVCTN